MISCWSLSNQKSCTKLVGSSWQRVYKHTAKQKRKGAGYVSRDRCWILRFDKMNSLFGRKKSSSTLCEGREWQEDNDRRQCLKVAANAIIVRSKKEQKMAFTETTKRAVGRVPLDTTVVFLVYTRMDWGWTSDSPNQCAWEKVHHSKSPSVPIELGDILASSWIPTPSSLASTVLGSWLMSFRLPEEKKLRLRKLWGKQETERET